MRRSTRYAIIGLAALPTLAVASPAWADCNPDFGDQIYRWVDQTVPGQSRRLAQADYDARVLNYFINEGDDLNARLKALSDHLVAAADAIRRSEAAMPGSTDLAAIRRDENASRALNQLYAIRAEIDEIRRRRALLGRAPTLSDFETQGLGNVGRSTLLESMTQLGDARAQSLAAKFSVSVSMSFDENGNPTGGEFGAVQGDMVDTIVVAVVEYASEEAVALGLVSGPFAPYVEAVYFMGKFAIEQDKCQKKVEAQERRFVDAVKLLPKRLEDHASLFQLYSATYARTTTKFAPFLASLDSSIDAADKAWRETFGYNAERQAAAGTVLTDAKVTHLRERYEQSGNIDKLFNEAALTDVASDLGNLNSYLAVRQTRLLSACGNLDGVRDAEDQQDALDFTAAAVSAYRSRPQFAPLHPMLDRIASDSQGSTAELRRLRANLRTKVCRPPVSSVQAPQASFRPASFGAAVKPEVVSATRLRKTGFTAARLLKTDFAATPLAVPATPTGLESCVLFKQGNAYHCGDGSGGSPYGGEFPNGTGDPRSDVLGGSHDGGYAADNRRIAHQINDVSQNIEARISEVNARAQQVSAALPEWSSTNQAFASQEQQAADGLTAAERAESVSFATAHAAEVATAKADIDKFIQQPTTAQGAQRIVQEVGGSALALPELRPDAVLPDLPALAGIGAANRVYPGSPDAISRLIQRERTKAQALPQASVAAAVSQAALRAADSFAATRPDIAADLVRDAAAARLMATGQLTTAEFTAVDANGQLSRVAVSDLSKLPSTTLLARAQAMRADLDVFDNEAASVQGLISSGQATALQSNVLSQSTDLKNKASAAFFGGDLIDGKRMMRMALAVLNVATSLTPGISWGRDVYEAVTGKDLFSGDDLDTLTRTTVIIGAITGGIGDEPLEMLRVVEKIVKTGESEERARKIVRAAESIDSMAVRITTHLEERAAERGISADQLEDALDRGSRWWDMDEKTIIALEEEPQGSIRAAVGVKPDDMSAVTVMAETRTNQQYARVPSQTKPNYNRFTRLDVNH